LLAHFGYAIVRRMTFRYPAAPRLMRAFSGSTAFILAVSLLAASPAAAQPADSPITESELAADIKTLSSDSFLGRDVGGVAEMRTIAHIVGSWAAAGLKPLPDSATPWLQAVTLKKIGQAETKIRFMANGAALPISDDDIALRLNVADYQATDMPLTFVGYGVNAAGQLSTDVSGKAVLLLAGEPPYLRSPQSLQQRHQRLSDGGAAAIFTIVDESAPWSRMQAMHQRPSLRRDGGERQVNLDGLMTAAAFEQLSRAAGRSARALMRAATSASFTPIEMPVLMTATGRADIETIVTHNVVAKLAGANPDGKAAVLMGHWDGMGICAPDDAADRICNGAVDNASGIAVINAVAKRLGSGAPIDRDIYFLATTSEEKGLLGAFHFVDHAPLPLGDIIVALNLDTVAIAGRGAPVAVIGRGRRAYDDKVAEVATKLGRRLDKDGEADAFVQRQDGWAFGARNVPALMVGGSFSDMNLLQAYLANDYHGPKDELTSSTPLGGAADDGDLHVQLIRAFASRTSWPADRR
jgi:hypothetical protein